MTRHVYHSSVSNGEREMYVYTPPNYDRSRRYPVLYLLGGSGELASNWNIEGRAGFIADNLIADGKAVPMIIAMPNNQVVHRSDPKHAELTFPLFEKELRQQIIPLVDRVYSTHSRSRTAARSPGSRWAGGTRSSSGSRRSTLFASFGILSAGDPESEKSTPEFLNDPATNTRGGLSVRRAGHSREPADESQRRVPPDPGEARDRARLLHRRGWWPRLGDVARPSGLHAAEALACDWKQECAAARRQTMTLTTAERRQLDEEGFVVLHDCMGRDLLRELRQRIHEIFDEEGERAGHEFRTEAHAHRLANLVDKGEVFRRAIVLPAVIACVRRVLGPQIKLSSLNARSADPNGGAPQPLHVDMSAIPDEQGYWVCNTVWMLDE